MRSIVISTILIVAQLVVLASPPDLVASADEPLEFEAKSGERLRLELETRSVEVGEVTLRARYDRDAPLAGGSIHAFLITVENDGEGTVSITPPLGRCQLVTENGDVVIDPLVAHSNPDIRSGASPFSEEEYDRATYGLMAANPYPYAAQGIGLGESEARKLARHTFSAERILPQDTATGYFFYYLDLDRLSFRSHRGRSLDLRFKLFDYSAMKGADVVLSFPLFQVVKDGSDDLKPVSPAGGPAPEGLAGEHSPSAEVRDDSVAGEPQ